MNKYEDMSLEINQSIGTSGRARNLVLTLTLRSRDLRGPLKIYIKVYPEDGLTKINLWHGVHVEPLMSSVPDWITYTPGTRHYFRDYLIGITRANIGIIPNDIDGSLSLRVTMYPMRKRKAVHSSVHKIFTPFEHTIFKNVISTKLEEDKCKASLG